MVGVGGPHASAVGQLAMRWRIAPLFPTFCPICFAKATCGAWRRSFEREREILLNLAQTNHPRIVLLTPGPFNETYFEHAYLARYLGFTLVEGADLTVRDRKVFLKTVNDSATGGCDFAARGRQFLRSSGTAGRFDVGRAGLSGGGGGG